MNPTHSFIFQYRPNILQTHENLYFYEIIRRTGKPLLRLCFFAWARLQIKAGDRFSTSPTWEQIGDHIKHGGRAQISLP
jgi:hypothetical protein